MLLCIAIHPVEPREDTQGLLDPACPIKENLSLNAMKKKRKKCIFAKNSYTQAHKTKMNVKVGIGHLHVKMLIAIHMLRIATHAGVRSIILTQDLLRNTKLMTYRGLLKHRLLTI